MKALYIGKTYICKEGEHHSSVTNGKIYEVEQYEHIDDPIYGNTFEFTDDAGKRVFSSKSDFSIIDEANGN